MLTTFFFFKIIESKFDRFEKIRIFEIHSIRFVDRSRNAQRNAKRIQRQIFEKRRNRQQNHRVVI